MAANKFCSECGTKLEAGAMFCGNCGHKVIAEEEIPPIFTAASTSVNVTEAVSYPVVASEDFIETQIPSKEERFDAALPEFATDAESLSPSQQLAENTSSLPVTATTMQIPPAQTVVITQPPPQPNFSAQDHNNYNNMAYERGTDFIWNNEATLSERFFSASGRLHRAPYNWRCLAWLGGAVLVGWIPVIGWILALASLFSQICMGIRRLHDLNKSGLWMLLFLVPLVGFALAVYMIFAKGTDGDNIYGPDPLRVGEYKAF